MKTSDFQFDLPQDLIAQSPPRVRGQSRLMVLDPRTGLREHRRVAELAELLDPSTLMIFNDTKVRKARVFGQTENGGRVELVFLRPLLDGRWECLVNRAKRLRPGQVLNLDGGVLATIVSAEGNVRAIHFEPEVTDTWLENHGHLPLPPYIQRPEGPEDEERYQTVFARELGSAAAPTAGLHFTPELLEQLDRKGIERAFVTLEVGLGTFLPVRVEDVADHKMHSEHYQIGGATARALNRAKAEGRPVLAVGTTSLRTLEASWTPEGWGEGSGSTDIFMTPGYRFRAVDALFTNFHTPESTLLMLVCALAGAGFLLESYRVAVDERYRFFSYGDAMLIRSQG